MKKEELLNVRDEWLKGSPMFVPTADAPALIQAKGDEFSGLKQWGIWDGRPATLNISSYWIPPVGDVEFENLRRNLALFEKDIRLPKLLKVDYTPNFRYLVEEIPQGEPVIDMRLFCGTFSGPEDREILVQQLREFGHVYSKVVSYVDHYCPYGVAISAAQYFHDRFRKWRKYAREHAEHGIASGFTDAEEAKIIADFFTDHDLSKVRMRFFFNIFGNTDIVKTEEGLYYLSDVKLEPKPIGFGVAAFIWNMLLYGWQKTTRQLIDDVSMVIAAMVPEEGRVELMKPIFLSLIERLYAAIEIDLRFCRSPYDNGSMRSAAVMMSRLKYLLFGYLYLNGLP